MNKKIKTRYAVLGSLGALLVPAFAFAQGRGTLASIVGTLVGLLEWATVLMLLFAVVMFVYYIIKYFIMADADRKAGGMYVLYSVLGFFIILSLWGIINILQGTFGLGNEYFQPRTWESFTRLFPGGSGVRYSPSSSPFLEERMGPFNQTNNPMGPFDQTR